MTTADLYAELDKAEAVLAPHHSVEAVVYKTMLATLRGVLTLAASHMSRLKAIVENQKILDERMKKMAATITDVQNALTTLDGDVTQLIAQHTQSLDGVLAQAQATDAKVKAALTPAATPTPTPEPAPTPV